jgi:ferredoxin
MECPVEAICTEEEVPEDQLDFIRINAEAAKVWPRITQQKPAPEDADEWAKVKHKRALLEFA